MTQVKLLTLDPGHFHAALVQKEMYPGVERKVHVYAPLGPDLLAHLNRIHPGECILESPVGEVRATLHPNGRVTVRNVPSYRTQRTVSVIIAGLGSISGDVAWGGNYSRFTSRI